MIPGSLDIIPTDVVEIGKITLGYAHRRTIEELSQITEVNNIRKTKVRPAPSGVSNIFFQDIIIINFIQVMK